MIVTRPKLFDHVPPQWPNEFPPKLALIGEAPGDIERLKGQPLVGPSGLILNQILRTANIDRSSLFIGNVFDEQLPNNEIANWCAPADEAKTWEGYTLPPIKGSGSLRPQYTYHLVRLREELEKAQAKVIVPLGGTALWAFTGQNAITAFRGAVDKASFIIPGAIILPTVHPQFVQHQWKYFHVVVGDLKKAMQIAEHGVQLTPRELWIAPSLADMRFFKSRYIDTADLLSIDIETGGGQITSFGVSIDDRRAITVPFVDGRKPSRSYWRTLEEEVDAIEWCAEICESPIPKVGQNFLYDSFWLMDRWGIHINNYLHDTRLMSHALYAEMPKDLGFLGAASAKAIAWKQMRERGSEKRDD